MYPVVKVPEFDRAGHLGSRYTWSKRDHSFVRHAFQGAVDERPQSLPLRAQLAGALLNIDEAQRARDVLEAGGAGNSRSPRALYLLSEAQRRTEDYAAAEVTARRLIALDPRALGGPRQLAQVFNDQREYQKIITLLEPIVTARLGAADAADLTSDTFRGLYFDLASAYEELRQFDKAIAMLTQASALSSVTRRFCS